ncbi:hypothetical protein AC578_2829 [Pseudocercospora eumusae]|uniref:Transcription initiation factor TFIID subunit 1 histone acetyltransferase domain-containing protein n=1 Tax=Pseudocercospora eumusae TaxID=321146 RepID=A0A139H160_9PEZI|nr:hypothetical protein AC578_2829 [Pseudocercospora eumusae]
MPHAIEDESMGGDSFNEADDIQRFLGGGLGMGDAAGQDQQFDQADKADDAIDYEDISDDELPDEEEPTHREDGEGEDGLGQEMYSQVPGSIGNLPVQPTTNGFHAPDESSDGLFADGDESNDLFGERFSSPEEERHPQHAAPQQRPGGLALPSKSSLALPTFANAYTQPQRRSSQAGSTSMSPPSFQDRDYPAMSPASMTEEEEDEDDLDPQVALQRRLFKASAARAKGEDVVNGTADTDMALFHHLYPGYERYYTPKFTELFPPRYVEYKGKAPLKPPKVLIPTKLSLDLLQDHERSFKALAAPNKAGQDSTFKNSFVFLGSGNAAQEESDEDLAESDFDEHEIVGGVSMHDLALICQDWDIPSITSDVLEPQDDGSGDDYDTLESARPAKKRKTDILNTEVPMSLRDFDVSFEDPEHAAAKLAKSVTLDLNDPHLLIDEHAPRQKKKLKRMPGELKRDSALSRDIAKRYNISNDQAYDLLKENHQHKVRSTLGSMAVEHSFPAVKLQYPFYRVALDNKAKRAFHRPSLALTKKLNTDFRFTKPRHIKKKNVRGKEAKEVFAKAEDLSLGDSASILLLEYSEEAPMTLSNFGMGNRFINYYRKVDADDQTRPKEPIGEAQVLLPQDKSPFANFGHVDKGETVPTIQNGLYRAPVFSHKPKTTDFIIGISSTYERGDTLYLRNVENLHTVGQQFPLAEVPGQHSRKVTDAAKKRLRALSYRIYTKSQTRKDKVLDNATLMPHLPGHDMPQTRSKMREFMKYERAPGARSEGTTGTWVPQPGHPVPDADTLRSWIRPEDVCLLDAMQVGVQHLADIGITESKDGDGEGDIEEGANIELQLAPWRATKNFLNACQGKAMLTLHGDGDPTGHGLGFSFVKTSMKGGFQAQGESASDKMDAKKRKDNGGHSYNVAKQQKQYDESIRRIWEQQKKSLSNDREHSDDDMDDEPDRSAEYQSYAHTPRSSMSTPAAFARHDDDSVSQFSGQSAGRPVKKLVITRKGGVNARGEPLEDFVEEVTNPAVIREYKKRAYQKQFQGQSFTSFVPTGDKDKDNFARQELEKELARIQRNADRREARDKLKAKNNAAGSPAAAASPGRSDVDGPASTINGGTDITPQKGKGRNKDGTARKCANCGQVGHIKTNRKSVTFSCPFCNMKEVIRGDSSHGSKKGGMRSDGVNGGESSRAVASSYSKFQL